MDGSELLITLIAALHVCRCAVTAHDVLRSAAEGVLPYLDTWPQVGPRVRDLQGGGLLQYAMRNACTSVVAVFTTTFAVVIFSSRTVMPTCMPATIIGNHYCIYI